MEDSAETLLMHKALSHSSSVMFFKLNTVEVLLVSPMTE